MMHFGMLKTSLLMLLLAAGPAFGNAAPPDFKPPQRQTPRQPLRIRSTDSQVEAPVRIWKNSRQKTTRIQIPAAVLARLQADKDGKVSQVSPQKNHVSRTIVAGLSLAMAAACGFVLLGRKGSRSTNVAVITFLVLSLTVAGGAIADLRVPDEPSVRPQPQVPGQVLSRKSDKVIIEITEKGKAIEVILGSDARWVR